MNLNRKREAITDGLFNAEQKYRANKGVRLIAGVDEAGRGPMAGPVVAAAVILRPGLKIHGVDDSKRLTAKRRESLFYSIISSCYAYGVGIKSAKSIDKTNIAAASLSAMHQAVEMLCQKVGPDLILVDGFAIPKLQLPQEAIIRGDCTFASIACASIVAKVIRDRIMDSYETLYPPYKFSNHKGYCTKEHSKTLLENGPTPIHRRSFRPVYEALQGPGVL